MHQTLKEIIKDLGIDIVIAYGIGRDGLYLPETNTIFIREGLTDIQMHNVLLHELGHLVMKHADTPLSSPCYHMKQESQADDFWLEALAKEYLSKFDGQPEYVDVYKFLSAYQIELNYYDKAKHILTKLMLESFA